MTVSDTVGDREIEDVGGQPMAAVAYQRMRQLILQNGWPPGFQATEQEVATLLGMSRTPVREALMRLQQDGLVTVVPRHGVRVLPVSTVDMKEIYAVLASLEATAAAMVASRRLGEKELAPLNKATDDMAKALKADDLDAWARADEHFHAHLLNLCGNGRLKAVVLNFWDQAHRVRMLTLKMRPKPRSRRAACCLVDALRKGDAELARRLHAQHRGGRGRASRAPWSSRSSTALINRKVHRGTQRT